MTPHQHYCVTAEGCGQGGAQSIVSYEKITCLTGYITNLEVRSASTQEGAGMADRPQFHSGDRAERHHCRGVAVDYCHDVRASCVYSSVNKSFDVDRTSLRIDWSSIEVEFDKSLARHLAGGETAGHNKVPGAL